VALLQASDGSAKALEGISLEHGLTGMLGEGGYQLLGVLFFVALATVLVRTGLSKK
jgi:hypothetical protein